MQDDLTHYDDPLGLFADKLGRALALQRTVDGHQLYPVFHHIHRLGQKSVLESTGSLCPLNHGVHGVNFADRANFADRTKRCFFTNLC
eukprot:SAG31_NODE_2277_length_6027_cov_4.019062_9_plen_88_part_00